MLMKKEKDEAKQPANHEGNTLTKTENQSSRRAANTPTTNSSNLTSCVAENGISRNPAYDRKRGEEINADEGPKLVTGWT